MIVALTPKGRDEGRYHLRMHKTDVSELKPISAAAEGLRHFFQYSKCTGKKKAVCVCALLNTLICDRSSRHPQIGINYIGQDSALKGCINDAHNVRRFLMSARQPSFPFGPSSLITLP